MGKQIFKPNERYRMTRYIEANAERLQRERPTGDKLAKELEAHFPGKKVSAKIAYDLKTAAGLTWTSDAICPPNLRNDIKCLKEEVSLLRAELQRIAYGRNVEVKV